VAADILPFLQGRSFDERTAHAIGEAYDKARRMLHDTGQPKMVQEIIATRIMDLAAGGEHDPDELARRALRALGMKTD